MFEKIWQNPKINIATIYQTQKIMQTISECIMLITLNEHFFPFINFSLPVFKGCSKEKYHLKIIKCTRNNKSSVLIYYIFYFLIYFQSIYGLLLELLFAFYV